MCADPATMSMVLAGGQAILGNYSAVQGASERNRQRKKLYDMNKLRTQVEHWRNINKYYLRGVDAEYAWAENALVASRAYEKEQVLLNEQVGQALLAEEQAYIKITGDTRIAKALEKSGVTARRIKRARSAAIGRTKAESSAKVADARERAAAMFHQIQAAKKKTDREADWSIGLEPERGPGPAKPVWDKGPSAFQQLASIGMAVGMAYLGGKVGKGGKKLDSGSGKFTDIAGIDTSARYTLPADSVVGEGLDFSIDAALNLPDIPTFNMPTLPTSSDLNYVFNPGTSDPLSFRESIQAVNANAFRYNYDYDLIPFARGGN